MNAFTSTKKSPVALTAAVALSGAATLWLVPQAQAAPILIDGTGNTIASSAVASSNRTGSPPSNAFDGNVFGAATGGDRWAADGLGEPAGNDMGPDPAPQSIYVNLGQDYNISEVQFNWEATPTNYGLYAYTGSSNPPAVSSANGANSNNALDTSPGAGWTLLASVSGRTAFVGQGATDETFDFTTDNWYPLVGTGTATFATSAATNDYEAQYLLLYASSVAEAGGISIYEAPIYGTAVVAAPEPSSLGLLGAAGMLMLLPVRRRRNA